MRQIWPRRVLGAAICLCAWLTAAHAQTAGQGASFIKPFPTGEYYRLQLVGDWFADGLRASVAAALSEEPQLKTYEDVLQVRTLRRASWDQVIAAVETSIASSPFEIAVVMFGAAEIGALRVPGKRRVAFGSDAWKDFYVPRVDRLMKALRRTRAAVYWIGIPVLRREDRNDGAQFINEIFRERAYINGIKYIDAYTGFADEDGDFEAFGPDLSGKIRRLRTRDGVYFTSAGYQRLAHFAVRGISIDLRKAIAERKIPLAGSELEQSRIRPRVAQRSAQVRRPRAPTGAAPRRRARRIASNVSSAPAPIVRAPGIKDQKADNSTIALRTRVNGVARTQTVEIVRPAIPATVLTLLTRRQSNSRAADMGDSVAAELPGGIVLLSSISPVSRAPAAGPRAGLSPTQSPFFKVWTKGERLTPRPGRADDIEWPRPEPKPVIRTALAPNQPGRLAADRPRALRKYTPEGFPPLPVPNPRPR